MMQNKRWIVLGSALAALLVVAAVGAQAVYADSATPPAPPDERGAPPQGAPRMRGLDPAGLKAAADVLGLTADELKSKLDSGMTLEEVATEQGADLETVRAAMQAAHKQTILEQINQAVTDGKMTQDKADWLIVGLEKGYLDGPGFGIGPRMGFGGPFGAPPRAADTTQTP